MISEPARTQPPAEPIDDSAAIPGAAADNPLHMESGAETAWTTVNSTEAMPGVMTPLGWTFWGNASERILRRVFHRFGAFSRRQSHVDPAAPASHRFAGIFYGRVASNLNLLREVGDRMPGASGDAVEEQLFGGLQSGLRNRPARRRYPLVALKAPRAIIADARRMTYVRADNEQWWRATVQRDYPSLQSAVTVFEEATERFVDTMVVHSTVTMVAQGLYDHVSKLAAATGQGDEQTSLTTGYGAMEETATLNALFELAQGRLSMEAFLADHGYHGPREGDIAGRSWREDPAPVELLLAGFRGLADNRSPRAVERTRSQLRLESERALLEQLGRPRRAVTGRLLREARRFTLLRQVGKVAFLQVIDGARAAARAAGGYLVADGVLRDSEEVFYLTADELCGRLPMPSAEVIAERTSTRDRYLQVDVPTNWVGQPDPVLPGQPARTTVGTAGEEIIRGVCGSAGEVEGVARLVRDPCVDSIEPGEIVVCGTTDPSWAPILFLAGGLVVDIGGPMSHAAIVARELGVPCVIKTLDGTKRITPGARVHVDGMAGTVHVLAQPAHNS